jgi:glutaminyl-peptide cyclotransferase
VRTLVVLAATLMLIGPARVPGFAAGQPPVAGNLPVAGYLIQHVYPHDPGAFTQGLQYVDGVLYEGTGLNGRSSIRKVNLETGEVLQQRSVPAAYFGEGIVVWHNRLIELTWQSQVAFIYDRDTFNPTGTFHYEGEGWGLTHDGKNLIMSDGSAALRVLDPDTFAERRRINVTANGVPVRNLNELEWVQGEIFANVWQTNYIARVSPATGAVTGWIDLHGLLTAEEARRADVLNGIAYDAAHDRLFVTGKLWPKIFELTLR